MKTKRGLLYLAVAVLTLVAACEKEGDKEQTYVGTWETEEFLNVAAGAYQQIIFNFSERF